MSENIGGHGITIPAKFDVFFTIIGFLGLCISLYLFWSEYMPATEGKTSYGIFISVIFVASASAFIFGAKAWKKRHDSEVNDEQKKRKFELEKQRLENKRVQNELKKSKN